MRIAFLVQQFDNGVAVDIAEKRGITMVGFMRGKRLNIYTHPEKIIK